MSIDLKLSLFKQDFSTDEFLSEFLDKKDNKAALTDIKKMLVQANNNIEDLLREIAALKHVIKPVEHENDLLTIQEVADIIKCEPRSVYRYIKTLNLITVPHLQRGKRIPRFEIQRIMGFIKKEEEEK